MLIRAYSVMDSLTSSCSPLSIVSATTGLRCLRLRCLPACHALVQHHTDKSLSSCATVSGPCGIRQKREADSSSCVMRSQLKVPHHMADNDALSITDAAHCSRLPSMQCSAVHSADAFCSAVAAVGSGRPGQTCRCKAHYGY